MMPAAVTMQGITKRFPEIVANDGVDFEAAAGEVHALLGENGAGKTTLSHILSGLYRPDEGRILLHGEEVEFASPREAIDAGIGMVHQHFRLVDRFTVAENLVLGDRRGAGRHFHIEPGAVETQVRELGERYRLPVDPRARIWQLSVGEQQRVEILNALYEEAQILILDEPTAVLTPEEADTLFVTLRQMADEGKTVIFISHKLQEVMAVSDRVTVLRAGKAIATVRTADATPQSLAALMVGREVDVVRRRADARPETAAVLEVDGIRVEGDRGAPAVEGRLAHRSRRARSSRSPASPATGSASSRRRSPGCVRARRARSASAASCRRAATRAPRSTPASATSRRTGSARGSRRRCRSR